nr:hypothetical protein [Rhodococcus sp. (in: high G+C Gram-positive bacteria)]
MSEVYKYVLVDDSDEERAEYDDYHEAVSAAEHWGYAIVTHTYEFADSELTWTPNGEDTWPPKDEEHEAEEGEALPICSANALNTLFQAIGLPNEEKRL